jgi:hypothetical protein
MRSILQWAFWSIGLGLQFLVASALLSGPIRKYWAIFFYTVVLFLTTVIDILAVVDPAHVRNLAADVYWAGEFLRSGALFGIVLASVTQAVSTEKRALVKRLVILFAMLFWSGSFYLQRSDNFELWMTNAFRNISFGAALINLALWLFLIATRRRDSTLLMISGGLGIQMTGEAIGLSLRQMSPYTVLLGALVAVTAHFVCLYIWWQALRSIRREAPITQTGAAPTAADPKRRSAMRSEAVAVN